MGQNALLDTQFGRASIHEEQGSIHSRGYELSGSPEMQQRLRWCLLRARNVSSQLFLPPAQQAAIHLTLRTMTPLLMLTT